MSRKSRSLLAGRVDALHQAEDAVSVEASKSMAGAITAKASPGHGRDFAASD
jgi:hypothetical protein